MKLLITLALIASAVYAVILWQKHAAQNRPGEAVEDLGRQHIALGQEPQTYTSNPPTSGPHYETWATWGVHDEVVADGYLIHNLEHGGIWISYKDPADTELIGKLKDIVEDYAVKVILTPRTQNDSRIAVVAWGRIMKLEEFDEEKIKDFIGAFINRGPEQVPF